MKVCGKVASFAQGFQKLWKTQKVNSVYTKLTQNSRELNLTQNLHKLNTILINTILTQNLQDLNTRKSPAQVGHEVSHPTQSVPPYIYIRTQAASCELEGKLQAGVGCYTSKSNNRDFVKFSLNLYYKLVKPRFNAILT